jgi:hypothetical protein
MRAQCGFELGAKWIGMRQMGVVWNSEHRNPVIDLYEATQLEDGSNFRSQAAENRVLPGDAKCIE